MEFKPVELNSKKEIEEYLKYLNNYMCDYNFLCLYMWRNYYHYQYAIYDDYLFIKVFYKGKTYYQVPIGPDVIEGVRILLNEFKNVELICVGEEDLELLDKNYIIEYTTKEKWYDYLYDRDGLALLNGKKYKQKRNHVNGFKSMYSYDIYDIHNIDRERLKQFVINISTDENETAVYDKIATLDVIDNIDSLGAVGRVLVVNNHIIAFSIGIIYNNTLYVSIEKADKNYHGTYEMINNIMAISNDVKYINREDDLGDEGLRRSKKSYNPIEIIKKYKVKIEV